MGAKRKRYFKKPPGWLSQLDKSNTAQYGEQTAVKIHSQISRKGGLKAYPMLKAHLDKEREKKDVLKTVDKLLAERKQWKQINSVVRKLREANEHIVPVDDTEDPDL